MTNLKLEPPALLIDRIIGLVGVFGVMVLVILLLIEQVAS
jgi:hypothetical protein